MKIERFEDIEAWQLAGKLIRKVYGLAKTTMVASDQQYVTKLEFQDVYYNAGRTYTLLGDSDGARCHSRFHQVFGNLRARSTK